MKDNKQQNTRKRREADYKGFSKNYKKEYQKAPKRKGGHRTNKYSR